MYICIHNVKTIYSRLIGKTTTPRLRKRRRHVEEARRNRTRDLDTACLCFVVLRKPLALSASVSCVPAACA